MVHSDNPNTPQSTLRSLQLTELDILKEFDRLCRKHHLHYYIVGGTLIGAVRHKGFIPWDDDIDVSMPRKDFKKFIKIAKEELSQEFFLQTRKTDKKCQFHYAKLRKSGTYFGEEKFEHTAFHKGIFMDIFPLDYIPRNKLMQKLIFGAFGLMSGLISSKEKSDEYLFRDRNYIFAFMLRCIRFATPLFVLRGFRTLIAKFSNAISKKTLFASLSGFHGYPKEMSPEKWWGEGCDIEFEGIMVKAPDEYETLLAHMFGNYMELPPEKDRINHSVNPDKIIFEGATSEDYLPKIKKKRKGYDYIITPANNI